MKSCESFLSELFFVYGVKEDGSTTEMRISTKKNLGQCAYYIKCDFSGVVTIFYNKAKMCAFGYIVKGEFMGNVPRELYNKNSIINVELTEKKDKNVVTVVDDYGNYYFQGTKEECDSYIERFEKTGKLSY